MNIVSHRNQERILRQGKNTKFGLKIGHSFGAESIAYVKMSLQCVLTDIEEVSYATQLNAQTATHKLLKAFVSARAREGSSLAVLPLADRR